MTATVTRPASSLTVPSTQNTAPVLDFRCLYTHDLRRKAKRWQDGLARFHTFNKRVMVYDETRNFIGDTHWREAEPIQDGDELQLDKGILIQIGEATGQTNQDISGLFEKRKTAPGASENESPARARQPPAPVPTAARAAQTAPSQLMPRTLNSVLGTPKGQLGRAALPAKSPFELRHPEGVENEAEERAAKRQRVSYPDTRTALSDSTLRSKALSKKIRCEVEPSHQAIECSEIDQNREQAAEGTRKPAKKPLARKPVPQPQKEYDQSAKKPQVNVTPGERNLGQAMKKASAPIVRSQVRDSEPSEVISVDSSGRSELQEDLISQGSRLRIATTKPRRKLMYKDLLPRAKQNTEDSSRNARSANTRESIPRSMTSDMDPLSQFHHQEQDRLRSRLQKHNHRRSPIQISDEPEIDENETSIPSEDESVYISTSVGSNSKIAASSGLETNNAISYSQHSVLEAQMDNNVLPTIDEPRHPSTSPASKLAEMDTVLLRGTRSKKKPQQPNYPPDTSIIAPRKKAHDPPPPKASSPPPPPSVIPAVAPDPQPPPPPSLQPTTSPKRLQRSLSTVISSSTKAQQPKRLLRKTVSDTSARFSCDRNVAAAGAGSLPLPLINVEAAPNPWSSEAWELFGWRREDFSRKGNRERGEERKESG